MTKHTPEPWKVVHSWPLENYPRLFSGSEYLGSIWNLNQTDEQHKANARRIVACVNACDEIETEELENVKAFSLNNHCREVIAKDKRIAELEKECATPILVNTTRLVEQLAAEREKVDRLREALENAREAMAERRGYAEMWEYKYRETWDEEDQLVNEALAATEPVKGQSCTSEMADAIVRGDLSCSG